MLLEGNGEIKLTEGGDLDSPACSSVTGEHDVDEFLGLWVSYLLSTTWGKQYMFRVNLVLKIVSNSKFYRFVK